MYIIEKVNVNSCAFKPQIKIRCMKRIIFWQIRENIFLAVWPFLIPQNGKNA